MMEEARAGVSGGGSKGEKKEREGSFSATLSCLSLSQHALEEGGGRASRWLLMLMGSWSFEVVRANVRSLVTRWVLPQEGGRATCLSSPSSAAGRRRKNTTPSAAWAPREKERASLSFKHKQLKTTLTKRTRYLDVSLSLSTTPPASRARALAPCFFRGGGACRKRRRRRRRSNHATTTRAAPYHRG